MSKIIAGALLIAFATFSSFNQTQPAITESSSSRPVESASPCPRELRAAGQPSVRILFSGLMVFHKEKNTPGYEVGILSPHVTKTHKHKFQVTLGGVPQKLPKGGTWTMEITNSTPASPIPPYECGHTSRLEDDENNQFDFSWIIDLESSEFHGRKLKLKPGLLKPIIHLPNGHLFTYYKSIDLKRLKGGRKAVDFGFIPETTALDLELRVGQVLVLKDDQGTVVFELPYNATRPTPYLVEIKNVRNPPSEASDFLLYYKLFEDVPLAEQFDFKENKGSGRRPRNPYPVMRTCCAMACGKVLLGQREEPLE